MSGTHRDEDLAYSSYQAQGESQDGEEGERGFVGDTLNSLLGRRPQGQQSVCELSEASIARSLTHSRHRTSLRPTNHNCMASSSSHTVDRPPVDSTPVDSTPGDRPPPTANLHQDSNGHLAPHLAGPSFSANSRMQYMTSARDSRPSCQAHQKSIATPIRVGTVHQAITMAS